MANPPAFTPPMLAKLVRTLPEGPDWEYELKLDGYRLQAIKDGDKVRLYSRRGNDFTRKFAQIATNVSKICECPFQRYCTSSLPPTLLHKRPASPRVA